MMLFAYQSIRRSLLHVSVLTLFIISLLSGIRLAFDNPWMPEQLLNAWFVPQGDVFLYHEWAAYGWLGICCYGLFHWWQVNRRQPSHYQRKNRLITVNYYFILGQVSSGLVLYLNQWLNPGAWWDGAWLNSLMLLCHYLLAMVFVVIVIAHTIEQLIKQSWSIIFAMLLPWRLNLKALLAFTTIALLALGFQLSHHFVQRTLIAQQIPLTAEIRIDGEFDEAQWALAQPVSVLTVQGNDYFSSTAVEIRMLHNGLSAYFAIRWPDPTPSYQHLPLIKTADGWQVQQQGFAKDDERRYYEDKIAVMLSQQSGLAGAHSIFLGPQPLKDKPKSRSGRGFHYTEDDSIRDVWHFKAVRTADMAYLDDNHFGAPAPACEACPRYTGGYRSDPKEAGSLRQNWTWFYPDRITPIRLPLYPPLKQQVLAQTLTDSQMSWFQTQPYSEAEDTYPIGTIMPSVLDYEGFEGDRANVSAAGRWHQGYWQLELSRNIHAESPYDLTLADGLFLWLAPFDHAQSRHSYHLKPIQLNMVIE